MRLFTIAALGVHSVAAMLIAPQQLPGYSDIRSFTLNRSQKQLSFASGPHSHDGLASGPITCPRDAPLSCHNTTAVENMCCFSHPGGQFLLAEFWDSNPPTGPDKMWTLHGLWPDHCDGTFDVYCDNSRKYSNITDILNHFGRQELLSRMTEVWKDFRGKDATLWEHEWNKHGTCTNTLNPSCYQPDEYEPTLEVVHYLEAAVSLFETLPSYEFLTEAGITPSTVNTYTRDQIQAALSAKHGGNEVTLGCRGSRLNEIWYHFTVRGSVSGGEFVPGPPDGPKSSCPAEGIRWLPKHRGPGGSKPPPPKKPAPTDPPGDKPSSPWSGRGFVKAHVVDSGDSKEDGCLIGSGVWFTSGTCATFTATPQSFSNSEDGSSDVEAFTLETRKGPCAFVESRESGSAGKSLVCAKSVRDPTVFVPAPSEISETSGVAGVPVGGDKSKLVVRFRAVGGRPGHAAGRPLNLVEKESDYVEDGNWVSLTWSSV